MVVVKKESLTLAKVKTNFQQQHWYHKTKRNKKKEKRKILLTIKTRPPRNLRRQNPTSQRSHNSSNNKPQTHHPQPHRPLLHWRRTRHNQERPRRNPRPAEPSHNPPQNKHFTCRRNGTNSRTSGKYYARDEKCGFERPAGICFAPEGLCGGHAEHVGGCIPGCVGEVVEGVEDGGDGGREEGGVEGDEKYAEGGSEEG